MRQSRASVLAVGLSVLVSLAGCVADSTKSASDTPASTPIASAQGKPAPPAAPSRASQATGGAGVSETGGLAEAAPTLTFTQAVHFVAADGSDLVTEAETYQVDAADSHLSLRAEGRAPLLLDATPTTHREEIAAPLAVLVPGDDPDVLHVVLLLANGQALDAAGSLSGTHPRAIYPMVSAYNLNVAVQGLVVQAPIVTVIDLNGRWTDGSSRIAAIYAAGTSLTIDMSAYHRPVAKGSIVNGSTISVIFPDEATITGILQVPNTIRWSNGFVWTKVKPAPPEKAPTTGGNAPPEKAPTPPRPDLVPVDANLPGFAPFCWLGINQQNRDFLNLFISVKNIGNTPAPASHAIVGFYVHGYPQVVEEPVPNIDTGRRSVVRFTIPYGCFDPATHYCSFTIKLDIRDEVVESNENNNNAGGRCTSPDPKYEH